MFSQFPGIEWATLWGVMIVLGLIPPDAPASLPVHPVQLYETLLSEGLFTSRYRTR